MNRPLIIHDPQRMRQATRSTASRTRKDAIFRGICIATASLSVVILVLLLSAIVVQGFRHLNLSFLTSPPNPDPARAGIGPALWGTVWVCVVCALFTLPIGVATAVLLEEFPPKRKWVRRVHSFIQLNIANLAGVPSVVYGIIGLTVFVQMFNLAGSAHQPMLELGVHYYDQYLTEGDRVVLVPAADGESPTAHLSDGMSAWRPNGQQVELNVLGPGEPLPSDEQLRGLTLRADAEGGRISEKAWYYLRFPFGRGILAGGLTLMLVVLPVLIISTQEALRAVPSSLRDGALGMGATRWQVVWKVTLPAALPGIMTGAIISMSRAIGEAAPLLMIAGVVFIANAPGHLMDDFTAMPLQIYNWAQRPQLPFHELAASGILVLLAVLLVFNALAIFIRQRTHKPLS